MFHLDLSLCFGQVRLGLFHLGLGGHHLGLGREHGRFCGGMSRAGGLHLLELLVDQPLIDRFQVIQTLDASVLFLTEGMHGCRAIDFGLRLLDGRL